MAHQVMMLPVGQEHIGNKKITLKINQGSIKGALIRWASYNLRSLSISSETSPFEN